MPGNGAGMNVKVERTIWTQVGQQAPSDWEVTCVQVRSVSGVPC